MLENGYTEEYIGKASSLYFIAYAIGQLINGAIGDKVKAKYDALIDGGLLPIKRWGKPEDIASAVWTLCNGSLPYVTG